MKILFFEAGNIWSRGLPDGLRDLGHTVRMSGPVTRSRVHKILSSFRPDLLITVGWGPHHTKEKQVLMRQCARKWNIPLVYWATEDPNFTKEFTLPLIRRMKPDFVFSISRATADFYNANGIPAAHMDFGFHSSIHRRVTSCKSDKYDIVVVANAYPEVLKRYPKLYRQQSINTLIRPLVARGIRVDFFGRDWSKMKSALGHDIPQNWIHGHVPYKDASKIYSSAKIVLGLQNYRNMVTQRTYEILGSSGFLLTCDTPGVRRLFRPGRDLIVSTSPTDTVRKIRRYLVDSNQREQIKKNGRKSVAKHHYRERARYMIATLRKRGVLVGNRR